MIGSVVPSYPPGVLIRQSITASSSVTTIDWRLGLYCVITLTANTSIAFAPIPPEPLVVPLTMVFIQDGTGNRTVTYTTATTGFATIYTEDGNQPLLNPGANARSELQNVLDPTGGVLKVLRIRQGVIGEQAIP